MQSSRARRTAPRERSIYPISRRLGDTDFQYQDLDPRKNEIRVLYIKAGRYDSPLECRILRVSLDSPPAFVALSYAWGDPEDTCLMLLEGCEFPLTRTLYGALQALRSPVWGVMVWADAICINQSNNTEKGLQVRKMTNIYAAAKETCVWLGLEEDRSAQGLALLDELALQTYKSIKSFIVTWDRTADFGALVDIFERTYWDRLWCVQELEYSRKCVVYCGLHSADWSTYTYVQSLFDSLDIRYVVLLDF